MTEQIKKPAFVQCTAPVEGLWFTDSPGNPTYFWRYQDGLEIDIREVAALARKAYDEQQAISSS